MKESDILGKEFRKSIQNISGDDYMEEIPVPIPNTEVKLECAENTCGLPCWEDRLSLDFFYKNRIEIKAFKSKV